MMRCGDDWLVEYADGALPPEARGAAEAHLAGCQRCRRELAALEQSGELLDRYWEMESLSGRPSYLSGRREPAECGSDRIGERRGISRLTPAAQAVMLASAAALVLAALGTYAVSISHDTPIHSRVAPPAELDLAGELARAEQIARLQTATEILAAEPGMEERSAALANYLSDTYGVATTNPSL